MNLVLDWVRLCRFCMLMISMVSIVSVVSVNSCVLIVKLFSFIVSFLF